MNLGALAMGFAFALMWSSAFTSARIIVADAPPLASLSLRFLISGIIGITIAKAIGQSWRLDRYQWRATIIFGLCQNALYLGLNFVAMQTIEASLASIIASTMPLMVALTAWIFLRERLSAIAYAGLVAGMIGVSLILGSRMTAGADLYGVGLAIVGALALALATLSVRSALAGGNLLMIVGLQMLVGAAILGVASATTETIIIRPGTRLIVAFIYTTIVPGLLATWVWFSLVNKIGATKAATFHFLNPFFGALTAAIILGEKLTATDMVGVLVIMAGIFAVQMSKKPVP